jgi:SPP1 gp7 family putative phage head morphogenesis protein
MRVSAELADNVRDALRASVNIDEIIDAFLATFPSDTPTRSQARDWARMNVRQNEKPLDKVLEDVWASGWVLGTDYATEAMRLAAIKKAPTFTIDWSKWKPGQPAAEAIVRPPSGLKRLLRRFRRQTIKGISDTNLSRIGTVLADGLAIGADSRSVARELMALGISGIMDDAKRAMTIAVTETSRAVGAATLARYEEMGLRLYEWITVEGEGVCEACDENAMAGPVALGDEFPSGDLHEPAHPNCRCKMAPFIENFSTPVRENVELGALADASKDYDPDQPRDEAGRFSSNGGSAEPVSDVQAAVSLRMYTAYGHDIINNSLRGTRDDEAVREETQRSIAGLDALISNYSVLPENTVLYRGIAGEIAEDFKSLQPGDTFTDKGYTSATSEEYIAQKFGTESGRFGNVPYVNLIIDAPAGSRALNVDEYVNSKYIPGTGRYEGGFTPRNESEFILPRDATFEVTKNEGNNLYVRLVNG